MKSLLKKLKELENSPVRKIIERRVEEFRKIRKEKDKKRIFSELCFCLLTANFSAERAIEMQDKMNDEFHSIPLEKCRKRLKTLGHRFPNARAGYIVCARENKEKVWELLSSEKDEKKLRNKIAETVKGLGLKEASHFLRNIGYENVAIIDFHIIDLLSSEGIIEKPKNLTRKKYLETEKVLEKISEKAGLSLSELDLYLWYIETGKVLK